MLVPSNGLTALDEPSEGEPPSNYGEIINWHPEREVLLSQEIRFLL